MQFALLGSRGLKLVVLMGSRALVLLLIFVTMIGAFMNKIKTMKLVGLFGELRVDVFETFIFHGMTFCIHHALARNYPLRAENISLTKGFRVSEYFTGATFPIDSGRTISGTKKNAIAKLKSYVRKWSLKSLKNAIAKYKKINP
jgi:hypothetical protein